jgi:hypothetical protein
LQTAFPIVPWSFQKSFLGRHAFTLIAAALGFLAEIVKDYPITEHDA